MQGRARQPVRRCSNPSGDGCCWPSSVRSLRTGAAPRRLSYSGWMPGVSPSITKLIADHARLRPQATFVEDARTERVISYGDLSESVASWHRTFDELELAPSAAVLIDVDDPLGIAVLQLAAISAGLRATAVDAGRPASEV